ncbi:uncharacterized protein ColSpa_07209 [Colletotrichum spaethianum]|uniref:ER-bound oxygenase mpaB/mpaB'/Rubber oxygenase catalytic domain-containing protein n=1 Tax=Colletotrichum spaethianum TaxID=700344 RepID=A0AA37LI91_9PEZI|nr:uncharacterized protein ColSpa_07209 [Colletotrichum spaethianum]GKT47028.1 hypothetical protein ColSpa_07209 [Colletotrichum spaethianum]
MAGILWYRGEEWRSVWDYWFKWTDEHFTGDDLPTTPSEKVDAPPDPKPHRDLYTLLRDNADSDEILGELWTEVNTIPDWVDWAQIERGQQVFLRYAGPAIFALTFQSLVGGMGGRRVVETLSRTGGFGVKVTRRRLLETFQHILQVTRDLASVQPGGDGFASSLRVRLGVPVNDLDSIGTISTFSATLLWIGLPRQGIFLTDAEKADYLALWRWVAFIMGTPTEAFASVTKARAMMESLLASEIEPSDTSRVLANNVLSGLCNQPPSHVSREFLAAETYWLNGPKLARALAVERPPFYYSLLIVGQCIFFMALFNLTVHKPELGALGKETNFEFQYIPTLDVMSTEAAARSHHLEPSAQGSTLGTNTSRRARVTERRSLVVLLVAVAVAGLLAWLGIRSASALFGRVAGMVSLDL